MQNAQVLSGYSLGKADIQHVQRLCVRHKASRSNVTVDSRRITVSLFMKEEVTRNDRQTTAP